GYDALCCFVTDCLNQEVLHTLAGYGIRLIALRSAGFDHVDLTAAKLAGITVVRVPKYSPEAVAEFAVTLMLVLNRKILSTYMQGLENNFSLDGLVGFNLYQKTVGIIGTGNIGTAFAKIMHGFGCRLLAVDPEPNDFCRSLGVEYVSLDEALKASDIISLHCPLNDQTLHLIDEKACAKMKKNAMLINTGRGALCDTQALIQALESNHLGYAGLDVYEKEKGLFFKDHQGEPLHDALFLKLRSLPNVLITPHQAFLTQEAVENIVKTTIDNLTAFERGAPIHEVV
ncbi:MAG: 2-hydroxyacid dehydrogenase, partial [Legionellaceae bacterium]